MAPADAKLHNAPNTRIDESTLIRSPVMAHAVAGFFTFESYHVPVVDAHVLVNRTIKYGQKVNPTHISLDIPADSGIVGFFA